MIEDTVNETARRNGDGPAHPISRASHDAYGMTKREAMATAIAAGFAANEYFGRSNGGLIEKAADKAVEFADALLRSLER